MKRLVLLTLLIIAMSCSSFHMVGAENIGKVQEKEFAVKNWNGSFVQAMSDAYQFFLENDMMPETITVEGVDYDRGKIMAASCQILKKIATEPETWQDEKVHFIDNALCADNPRNNTLDIDEMTLEQFLVVADKIYGYAEINKAFPNYCTIDADYQDADGSKYPTQLISNAIYVTFARIFGYFATYNKLPEKFSVWHSDFLRSVTNCPIDDPAVIAAMEEAISGKTTNFEKAKALFEYSLNKWEWINYSNTAKGAVKTIIDKEANCCDLSHALVAMSRAAGLPARYYHGQCRYIKSGKVIGHVMAEIYVDGKWYLCDVSSTGTTFGNHEAWSTMETFNGRYNELPF